MKCKSCSPMYSHNLFLIHLLFWCLQVKALAYGRDHRSKLIELMNQKEAVGDVFNQLRLALQRRTAGRPAQVCFRPSLHMSFI